MNTPDRSPRSPARRRDGLLPEQKHASSSSTNPLHLPSAARELQTRYVVVPDPVPPPPDTTFGGRIRPKQGSEAPSVQLLCERTAFVYQRLSTTEQKQNSRYSLERQDDLERMAQQDGYRASLTPSQIEELRKAPDYPGYYLNGQIIVETRDLGISGTKGREERKGLAHLVDLIEQDRVESVYVIEISRISRDQTLITGLQFGELCREHNVIIVTPSMRLNLRDEMHMRMYRYEIDRAAEELKSIRARLHGAKVMKARHGYHVGSSLPPGYVIDRDEYLPDGSLNPNFQKYKIYEPHAEVVRTIFRLLAEPGAYMRGVALECQRRGIAFSRLPDDLLKLKSNAASFANTIPNADGSYPITVRRLMSIVSNPAYIGWFVWSGEVISKNNHPPIIDEETFWAVQKKRHWTGFHHEEHYDPLPLAGLLYCAHHQPPYRMVYDNHANRQRAEYHCRDEDVQDPCIHLSAYIIDDPISELVIQQCSFPGYTDQVLQQLTDEHEEAKQKVAANKREFQRIVDEIDNLKANLSRTRTPEQVDMLLELIDKKMKEKERLTSMDSQPIGRILSAAEVRTVREFLTNLETGWAEMPDRVKNSFLNLVLERIDIRHDKATITAIVTWRTGLQQVIRIQRPFVDTRQRWTEEELTILRTHYPSMPQNELSALLGGRDWKTIRRYASLIGLHRCIEARKRSIPQGPYTEEEDQLIRDFCSYRLTWQELVTRLPHRTYDSIWARSYKLGLRRMRRIATWTLITNGEENCEVRAEKGTTREVVTNGSCCRGADVKPPWSACRIRGVRRGRGPRGEPAISPRAAASAHRPRVRHGKWCDEAHERDAAG